MARHAHWNDNEVERHHSTPATVPPTGVIKLQPNRRNMTGPWRRIPTTELSEGGNREDEPKYHSTNTDSSRPSGTSTPALSASAPVPFRLTARASHLIENQNPSSAKHTSIFQTPPDISMVQEKHYHSVGINLNEGDRCEHLFGKLPDPIYLHEHMGQFDGQVVFIAHPSRDISAHQWSSASFQWINIGRYAHHRGSVEGSLASDRSKEYTVSENPLEFFKCAAENRERLIKENGRPKESPDIPKVSHRAINSSKTSQLNISLGSDNTLKEDYLEDPFVVAHEGFASVNSSGVHPSTDKIAARGSMDFDYEFPFKPIAAPALNYTTGSRVRDVYSGPMKTCYDELYRNATLPNRLSQLALRDIAFGEDAASAPSTPDVRGVLSPRTTVTSSPEEIRFKRVFSNEQVELRGGDYPNSRRVEPIVHALVPPPGLTVANPHRVVSNLNASAPPYSSVQKPPPGFEPLGTEVANAHATSVALRFSDPDGLRPAQEYEIANGLNKQPPTKQNFKGPFFTDSKPSTSDPTASLSVHVSEEEKLSNWFRDGHRAARQQEYAKTLMTAAGPMNRNNRPGIIGDAGSRRSRGYDNTPTFVRLYECLSEYVEESRGTGERSYFTRAWKPAPPALRDQGPEGNNSFFTSTETTVPGSFVNSSRMAWETAGSTWDLRGSSPFEYRHRFF